LCITVYLLLLIPKKENTVSHKRETVLYYFKINSYPFLQEIFYAQQTSCCRAVKKIRDSREIDPGIENDAEEGGTKTKPEQLEHR